VRDLGNARVICQGEDRIGIHEVDDDGIGAVRPDHDIAGKERAHGRVCADHLIGVWGVARSEYQIRLALNVQFVLQRGCQVDLGQYAEAMRGQRLPGSLDDCIELVVDGE
jgi:hypothetical protein